MKRPLALDLFCCAGGAGIRCTPAGWLARVRQRSPTAYPLQSARAALAAGEFERGRG